MTVKLLLVKSENGLETRQDYDGLSSANPAFTGTLTGGGAALTGSVDAGGEIKSGTLVGAGARPLVALADGTIDDQDAATFRGTIGALAASLKGAANGVAELGADVKVPVAQLPSAALLALGADSTTAHRGDHGATAYAHSQATGNAHSTTPAQIGALQHVTLSGAIDFNSINGGAPCVATGDGTSYANSPYLGTQLVGYGGTLYQGEGASGSITQLWADVRTGSMYYRGKTSGTWGPWVQVYDGYNTPISTFAKTLLDDASSTAARATLSAAPLAGAEVLIHSDFGRSATTDVWQSAFTDNTAAGLQLAANSIASGTEITIEQAVVIPADASGAAYQFYIGPQLTGEDAPSGSTYAIVLDPNEAGYGQGIVRIKCELIGSGSSITGYVTSTFFNNNGYPPTVKVGTITVNGTIANSIDVRFNPQSVTSYIIRRNRVRRCNP